MFSCDFYGISKNIFFYRTPAVAASANWNDKEWMNITIIKH